MRDFITRTHTTLHTLGETVLTLLRGNRVSVVTISALLAFLILATPVEAHAFFGWVLDGVGRSIAEGAGKIFASFLFVIVQLLAGLLMVVGMGLNWVVLVTVFQFSTYFGNSAGMLLAWTTLRDLANIILLFGFVWIGLQTILNVGHHFSVNKALPRLLIFAILINFSLFISEAIVDVSNVFTAVLYEQAGDVDCRESSNQVECVNVGITGNVIGALGFSGVLGVDAIGQVHGSIWDSNTNAGNAVLAGVLTLIFLIVLIAVFLAVTIMLLIRAVVLIFVLVLSPLGFVGMAIPQFEEQSQKWWKMLISNAFFAPVFFILFFVSLKIMEGAQATFSQGNSFAAIIASPDVNAGGLLILFGLMIGFLIFSLIAAKNMGAFGADFATNTAGKMTGAMTFGAAAWVGKKTFGAYAHNQAEKIRGSDLGRTRRGQMLIKTFDTFGKGSYDARQANVMGVAIGKNAIKASGIDFGEGKKGGYTGELHAAEEKRKKMAEGLVNTTAEKQRLSDIEEEVKEKKKVDADELATLDAERRAELAPIEERIKDLREKKLAAEQAGNKAQAKAMEDALGNELRFRDLAKEKHDEARKNTEAEQKKWMDTIEAEKVQIKRNPQEQYARRLGSGPDVSNLVGKTGNTVVNKVYNITMSSTADHHAAESIVKGLNKKDTDKIMDAIKGLESKVSSGGGDGHGGGGDSHAKPAAHAH